MKILPGTDTLGDNQFEAASPTSMKISMHVLGVARTDYRVLREAAALVEAGFTVSIVDIESERNRPREEEISGICIKHIIKPKWFIPTRFKPWFLVKLAQMIIISVFRLLDTQADIYHAHDANALPACFIAATLKRKPLIFDAHELPLDEPNITRRRRLSALATRVLAGMLPRCAGIIATSPPTAQEICSRYAVSEVTLVRNVPVYQEVPRSNRLRQYLGLDSQVRVALYQGYLQPDRGLERLVHAATFLEPNTVIVMMGKEYGTTKSQLEALIVAEGVADRVKIIPAVPYTELLHWTASADIGLIILPLDFSLAVRMMLPNKLFEYLMAGLPVLASPVIAVSEVIRTHNVGHILSSIAPADVGAAINAMLADSEGLVHMRRNALDAARSEFYWEKERGQLLRLYSDILAKRSGTWKTQHKDPISNLQPSPTSQKDSV